MREFQASKAKHTSLPAPRGHCLVTKLVLWMWCVVLLPFCDDGIYLVWTVRGNCVGGVFLVLWGLANEQLYYFSFSFSFSFTDWEWDYDFKSKEFSQAKSPSLTTLALPHRKVKLHTHCPPQLSLRFLSFVFEKPNSSLSLISKISLVGHCVFLLSGFSLSWVYSNLKTPTWNKKPFNQTKPNPKPLWVSAQPLSIKEKQPE